MAFIARAWAHDALVRMRVLLGVCVEPFSDAIYEIGLLPGDIFALALEEILDEG